MNRMAFAWLAAASLLAAAPASAVTNENGEVLITQAAVNAGNITPGDTPGFPVTISRGGSYRLASNLVVTTTANGIEVRANDVTIDMGGFTLAGSGVGRNGITIFNRNLRVANGQVRGFINDGIRSIVQFLAVDTMVVTANGRFGVHAEPVDSNLLDSVSFASVAGSKVTNNAGGGIRCMRHCRVENSLVSSNAFIGVNFVGIGGLALGNSVTANGTYGLFFSGVGGAGNNVLIENPDGPIFGNVVHMQPNACSPACPPPP